MVSQKVMIRPFEYFSSYMASSVLYMSSRRRRSGDNVGWSLSEGGVRRDGL